MNFKQSAIEVLTKAKKPLHYKEIARLALENGLLQTEGATPDATMNSQIILDIRHKKNASDFRKVAPSTYELNTEKTELKTSKKFVEKEQIEEEKIIIEGSYTGKAGEHLVCAMLLFRGFNASIMSVDVGLDIVAVKDEKMFGVQVKTSNLNRFDTYVFDVRKVSFDRHNSGNIYYIFVLHGEKGDQFLILPFHEMEKKVHEGAILEILNGARYRVNIKFRNNGVYLGNMNHEMSYFLNRWDVIK